MKKLFRIQPSNLANLHTTLFTLQAVEYQNNRFKGIGVAIPVSSPEITQFDMHHRQGAEIMMLGNSNTFIKNF